jgi:uncharacterized membrane protein YphA (DoxX/SURF4 family)
MNTVIWILQAIIAMVFLMAGFMKVSNTKDDLKTKGKGRMDWVEDLSMVNIRMIGIIEILAAVGLILPQWTGILPWLTPVSATGLVLTMMGSMILHMRRGDGVKSISVNIMLLLIAAFVAYGRYALVPA